jgi:adenosylcobalamin-dependent ribonucleoside-triphosphate reductase
MLRSSYSTDARSYAKGIGDAVADRTINRKKADGSVETWADVAERVALGNTSLEPRKNKIAEEFEKMHHHLRQASLLMSGRHLQHGDENQASRNLEVFTNCSTAASTFLTFYLLLNGSGVGRCYDDDMMLVDYSQMPIVEVVCREDHADILGGRFAAMTAEQIRHNYSESGRSFEHFMVPDTREGWAKALELMELRAFERKHRDDVLILDFSGVRPYGSPIMGMQGRPASGPGPLMEALRKIAKLRGAGMAPWLSTMYADHYSAECVLVGGARRAARMATKTWRDKSVLEFIKCKQKGGLWSSNNSVTVDALFWKLLRTKHNDVPAHMHELWGHAQIVFEMIAHHSYHDRTGEPGLINVDKLSWNDKDVEKLMDGNFASCSRYTVEEGTKRLQARLAWAFSEKPYKVITNPCGEIVLILLGGYCVIADVVPYHAGSMLPEPNNCASLDQRDRRWDQDAEDAFRTATRALIRTNLMSSLYSREVRRTNRIGVGFTGIHEYAWSRFGFGFRDLIDEAKSRDFWLTLARFAKAVDEEAVSYSKELGVVAPHTARTVKPAGTTSKLFGLTEGAHLPSMREYLRWVQFRNDDPLVNQYAAKGYPVIRKLNTYEGTSIVGFPTQPTICTLGLGDKLVTAAEATPEEQYQWLRLLEKYWIRGLDLPVDRGNQVSYTLKYDPKVVSYDDFRRAMLDGQSTIRCCSVMPQEDGSAYEYLPEHPITKDEFEKVAAAIKETVSEDMGFEHLDCAGGACPVDFKERKVA